MRIQGLGREEGWNKRVEHGMGDIEGVEPM